VWPTAGRFHFCRPNPVLGFDAHFFEIFGMKAIGPQITSVFQAVAASWALEGCSGIAFSGLSYPHLFVLDRDSLDKVLCELQSRTPYSVP
jgi:hypothetical protein